MNETTLIGTLAAEPEKSLLDEAALAALFNVSVRTIKRWVKRGELPAPVRFGYRKFWMAGRVLAHIETRIAAEESARTRRMQARERQNPLD